MSNFSRFQDRNRREGVAESELNALFIDKGALSITLTGDEEEQVQAAVVNKQEQNIAYIYTHSNTTLDIGSIWSTTNLHFLVQEEQFYIQHVHWHKYKAIVCNLAIADSWGYFIGPEKSFISTVLDSNKIVLKSNQHPILVCGGTPYNINDKIMINNRAFLMQEADTLSTPGVTYYSLSATTISKNDVGTGDVSISESQAKVPIENKLSNGTITVSYNTPITLSTENGYFKSSSKLIAVSTHTSTQVKFTIPFGIDRVEIKTKQSGNVITSTYVIGE